MNSLFIRGKYICRIYASTFHCYLYCESNFQLLDGFDTRSGNILSFLLPLFQEGQLSVTGESMFDTRSGNILSFLLPLFQEGQLSVTGESMCTKYWLTA